MLSSLSLVARELESLDTAAKRMQGMTPAITQSGVAGSSDTLLHETSVAVERFANELKVL